MTRGFEKGKNRNQPRLELVPESGLSGNEALRLFDARVHDAQADPSVVASELLERLRNEDERNVFLSALEQRYGIPGSFTESTEVVQEQQEGKNSSPDLAPVEPEIKPDHLDLSNISALGNSEESISMHLGDASGRIGNTPYWIIADGSVIILDKLRGDDQPMPLRIQVGGMHTFRISPGILEKMQWTSESDFQRPQTEPSADEGKMTMEDLTKSLESLPKAEPDDTPPHVPRTHDPLPENFGGFQFPHGQRELTFKGRKMYISPDGSMKMRVGPDMQTFADGDTAEFSQWNSTARRSEKVPYKWNATRTVFEEVHPPRAAEGSMDWQGRTPYDDVA